jgi:hypothetical protein
MCSIGWLTPVDRFVRRVRKDGNVCDRRLAAESVCDITNAYVHRLAAFGAHSLCRGFLTSAAPRVASVFKMHDVSRHNSMDVLQAP